MLSTLQSVSALLLSFGILCIGHGLGNTLLGVRADLEGFPAWAIGLMSSGYFAGFIVGVRWCARLLPTVGHIRVFAALTALASVISLLHLMLLDIWSWILLRSLYGICIAGLYMVIESWLNALAPAAYRSRILSTYMAFNFLCLSAGQLLFHLDSPAGHGLFVITSILVSLAMIPLTLSRAQQPELGNTGRLSLRALLRRSPLSIIGCLGAGMISGGYWGLTALYLSRSGLAPEQVATAFAAGFLGGLMLQWPIGQLSDRFDRRYAIAGTLGLSALASAALGLAMIASLQAPLLYLLLLLFGGAAYTLYSLFVALAYDRLEPENAVSASGALIMVNASGAIVGPLLVALGMLALGRDSFFFCFSLISLLLLAYTIHQLRTSEYPDEPHEGGFVAIPRTTTALAALDSRLQDEHEAPGSSASD